MLRDISRDIIAAALPLGKGGSLMPQAQPMTEAMYSILLRLWQPGHGYEMIARIRELSGGRVEMGPGTLYGVLTRMKEEGLIVLASEQERRKTYAITQKGLDALRVEYRRLKHMVQDGAALEEQT